MRRLLLTVLFLAAIAFAGGFVIFSEFVTRLRPPDPSVTADGVVALTGGPGRIDTAMDLLEQGQASRMLVSGVASVVTEEELRALTGASEELFDCCIDVGRAAQTTDGNATETADWAREHAMGSIIVVTSDYHMPRALMVLRPALGEVELTPWPVLDPRVSARPWWGEATSARYLFREYAKFLAFVVRDRVGGAPHPEGEPAL